VVEQSEANRNSVERANDAGAAVGAAKPASRAQTNPPQQADVPQPSRATDEPQTALLERLRLRQRQLEALLEESLDDSVELSQLLGVNPADPLAVALQVRQWEAVLGPPAELIIGDAGAAPPAAETDGLSA